MYSSLDIGGLSFTCCPYSSHLPLTISGYKQLTQLIGQHKYSFWNFVCGHPLNSIPLSTLLLTLTLSSPTPEKKKTQLNFNYIHSR